MVLLVQEGQPSAHLVHGYCKAFDTYEGRCDHGKVLKLDAEVSDVFSTPSKEEAEKLPPR